MQTCSNCAYYVQAVAANDANPHGYCHVRPPVVLLMPVPVPGSMKRSRLATPTNGTDEQQAILQPVALRPVVRPTDPQCAEHKHGAERVPVSSN